MLRKLSVSIKTGRLRECSEEILRIQEFEIPQFQAELWKSFGSWGGVGDGLPIGVDKLQGYDSM